MATPNYKEDFIEFNKCLIHKDYICAMEFREDEKRCYVVLKNSQFLRQTMNLKAYKEFQQEFLSNLDQHTLEKGE